MGKHVPYIVEDRSTGRLFYRHVFPERLRPFLDKHRRDLKVPLGTKGALSSRSMLEWEKANRLFEQTVKAAAAAKHLQEKATAGTYDSLSRRSVFSFSWTSLSTPGA